MPDFISLPLSDPSLLRQQCLVAGAWVDADDGATITVTDPATGAAVGTIPDMGGAEARRAIDAAKGVFDDWRRLTAGKHTRILRHLFELMLANREDLALIMTAEQGKPLAESRGEIGYVDTRECLCEASTKGGS